MDQQQLGELVSGYIDGELDRRETEFVEHLLREDADARRLLNELRQTVSVVASLPRHAAPPGISEDVQLQLERSELLGDQTSADSAPIRRSPLFALLSMAATIGLLAGGWWAVNLGDDNSSTGQLERVAMAPEESVFSSVNSRAAKRGRGDSPGRKEYADDLDGDSDSTSLLTENAAAFNRTSYDRLAEAATIDQKLKASGFEASIVKKHSFENETVRLDIPVRNAAERDLVAARLVGFLAAGTVEDVEARSGADGERKAGAVDSFYFRGQPTVNFEEEGERQVLVRASRRELDGLMTELGTVTKRQDRVSLQAGPLAITGMDRARVTLVHGLRDTPKLAGQAKQDRPSETGGDALEELFKGFGLTKDLTVAGRKGADGSARAKKTRSSRRRRTATRNKTEPHDSGKADAQVPSARPEPGLSQVETSKQPEIDRPTTGLGPKIEANAPGEILLDRRVDSPTSPDQKVLSKNVANEGELVQPSPTIRGSLVDRRMEALTIAQRDRGLTITDNKPADAFDDAEGIEEKHTGVMASDGDANAQESYVTLVFRIVIESNRKLPSHRLGKPSNKAGDAKPSGDPRME